MSVGLVEEIKMEIMGARDTIARRFDIFRQNSTNDRNDYWYEMLLS